MKVLFLHPASGKIEYASNFYVTTGALLPPLGILYLARILEINGHRAEVIDCNAETITENTIRNAVKSNDAVGITIYSELYEQNNSKLITKLIRDIDSDIPIIIGGPHCSLIPEQSLLDHKANICVRGSGETLINPIIQALEGKRDISSIPNIYFRVGERIRHTKPNKIRKRLDELPYPARHLVDKYDYGYMQGKKISKGKLTSITTSRGCAYNCNFCNLHAHIPEYSFRSAENITKEIEDIANNGYNTLAFVDDNFIFRKKVVAEIMNYIKNNNIDLRLWIFGTRADFAERSLFEKMRDAGTEVINFGIESGSQEVLDYYNKKLTIPQIKKAVYLSKEMGFFVTATFIIGAPIETKYHINQTIKFANSLPLDSATFFLFQYTYKSKIWEDSVKDGKIRSDEFRVIPDKSRGLGNFTSEELIKFTRKANFLFFMNLRRWIRTFNNAIKYEDYRTFIQGLQMFKRIVTNKEKCRKNSEKSM